MGLKDVTKETAYSAIKKLTERFQDNYESYKNQNYNETQTRIDFINPFFKALGWDMDNEQGFAEAYREVIHEDRVKVGEAVKAPDYCFTVQGQKKLFYVEAKKPSVTIKDDVHPAYQVRRYGWSAKLPLSVVTDFEELAVYDTSVKPNPKDNASVARIKYITCDKYLNKDEFDFIWDTFSKEKVLKGSFDKYIKSDTKKRGTSSVDKEFLESLDSWREELAKNITNRNADDGFTDEHINYAVQNILDRIIFLRICEDRGVEPYGKLQKISEEYTIYQKLLKYFYEADERYNSGLFRFKKDKNNPQTPVDDVTPKLILDDKVLKKIIKELYYPESPYQFSEIPVEILGQAYEQFLGKVIRVTKGGICKIEEKPEVRKAGGVYYTPEYIVDYIVKNTVGKLIESKKPKDIEKIKIVDPACGSGSFLIGAYKYLLNYHLEYYTQAKKQTKEIKNALTPDGRLTTNEKKRILLNNIHGVDIDSQAVEVTKLSLLLKAMEGETESSIKQQMVLFHERVLPTLDNNIKCGNSLIGMDFYEGELLGLDGETTRRKIKPFDWRNGFPEVFKQDGFDAVIGNPPYVILDGDNTTNDYFKSKYNVSRGGKTNLYKLFIEKSYHLLKTNGLLGFICPSNYLSSADSLELRKLLLNNTNIREIIEYTEKDKVFLGVTQALTTITFEKTNSLPRQNLFIKTSKHGVSTVNQKSFYGSDDLEFIPINSIIKKMQKNEKKFQDIIEGFQGEINVSTKKEHFCNKPQKGLVPLLRGNLVFRYNFIEPLEYCPLEIDTRKHWKLSRLVFQEVSNQAQPRRIKAMLIEPNYLCGHTTNYCFIKNGSACDLLFLLGVLNSSLVNYYFKYFNNTNHVPIGEIKKIPICVNTSSKEYTNIITLTKSMLVLNEKERKTKTPYEKEQIKTQTAYTDKKIDELVPIFYGLTEEEIKIVERDVDSLLEKGEL